MPERVSMERDRTSKNTRHKGEEGRVRIGLNVKIFMLCFMLPSDLGLPSDWGADLRSVSTGPG